VLPDELCLEAIADLIEIDTEKLAIICAGIVKITATLCKNSVLNVTPFRICNELHLAQDLDLERVKTPT
jgi:hypothetical protein